MPCMLWQSNVPSCSKKCSKINTLGLRMAGSEKAMSRHEIGCSSYVAFLGGCKINAFLRTPLHRQNHLKAFSRSILVISVSFNLRL